jgi:hypothetical protein
MILQLRDELFSYCFAHFSEADLLEVSCLPQLSQYAVLANEAVPLAVEV